MFSQSNHGIEARVKYTDKSKSGQNILGGYQLEDNSLSEFRSMANFLLGVFILFILNS